MESTSKRIRPTAPDNEIGLPEAQARDFDSGGDGSSRALVESTANGNSSPGGTGGGDTGSVPDAVADDFGGMSREEYEFQMGMMNAMEDGIEEDEDGHIPPGNAGEEDLLPEAHEGAIAGAEPAADERGYDLEAEDYEDAVGMMNAMEDGVPDLDGDDDDHEDRDQTSAQGHFARVSGNIVQACSSLSQAVREYYRMPQNDQVQIWEDLAGQNVPREPPDVVEATLKELPLELQRMPSSHPHNALDLALEKFPNYVNDRAFQLKFLRAEKFDVFAAATRMCRHFEEKLPLFGEDALGREITLDDLDEDDMDALKSGYLQILPHKDHGHRPVIFYYKAVSGGYKNRENLLRAYWYVANRLSLDEEIQKLGVGNLVYNIGGFPQHGHDYEKSRRLARCFQAVPVRYNTFYVCLDDAPWLTVVETFAVMITRFLRVRLRMLKGNHEEVTEKLKLIGLPAESLPVNAQSELLLETHLEWIEKQRREEESDKQQVIESSIPELDAGEYPP